VDFGVRGRRKLRGVGRGRGDLLGELRWLARSPEHGGVERGGHYPLGVIGRWPFKLLGDDYFGRSPRTPSTGVWSAVSAGGVHNCAVSDVGEIDCWALNAVNQAGHPTIPHRLYPQARTIAARC
jgi:hypothetical protein